MTNLERLKLELAHKDYFTDTELGYFLKKMGLMLIIHTTKQRISLNYCKRFLLYFKP